MKLINPKKATLLNALVLIVVGITGYIVKSSPTALIPVGFGILLLLCYFVYDKNKPQHTPNFEKFHNKAMELKKVNICNLGRGQITCISAEDTLNLIKKEIKIKPDFLIDGQI